MPNLEHILKVELANTFVCALSVDGTVICLGDNKFGQLGDGTTTDRSTVGRASLQGTATDLSASVAGGVCAVADAKLFCWGKQVLSPDGGSPIVDLKPQRVSWTADVAGVAVGNPHRCLVDTEGTTACWGGNFWGQLGDGTTTNRPTPALDVVVSPGKSLTTTSGVVVSPLGNSHACTLSAGAPFCWGGNVSGQLGNGTQASSLTVASPFALAVANLGTTELLAAGNQFSCAVSGGALSCWGSGSMSANGAVSGNLTKPTLIPGVTGVTELDAGWNHSCFLAGDGQVYCMGSNAEGQLGRSSMLLGKSSTPLLVVLP